MPKYFGVGDDGKPTFLDAPAGACTPSPNPQKVLIKRIKHSLYDWQWARKQGGKYANIAQQDFEHLLVAIDDLFSYIKECQLTDAEKNEFKAFLQSLNG